MCFLFLLTMPGSHDEVARDAPDWENMTNKELHDKFAQMMSEQVNDIENRFTEAIDGVEKMIDTKLDAKFTELIARLPAQPAAAPAQPQPPPPRRARRILFPGGQAAGIGAPAAAVAAAAAASDVGQDDNYEGDYEEEVEQEAAYEQPAGRPRPNIRHGRHQPPPPVRDDEYVPKLKLNLKPFEGRYIPDAYLTWEL